MAIYSGFSHWKWWKWWFSIVMLVYQRVILNTPSYGPQHAVSSPTSHHGFIRGCWISGKGIHWVNQWWQHGFFVPHQKDPGEEYPITSWALYIYNYNIYIYMYVYTICRLQNHKDKMFCPYGFGHVFCPSRFFFQIQPCPAANPLLYRSIVFLKSWICRTGSDSMCLV